MDAASQHDIGNFTASQACRLGAGKPFDVITAEAKGLIKQPDLLEATSPNRTRAELA